MTRRIVLTQLKEESNQLIYHNIKEKRKAANLYDTRLRLVMLSFVSSKSLFCPAFRFNSLKPHFDSEFRVRSSLASKPSILELGASVKGLTVL